MSGERGPSGRGLRIGVITDVHLAPLPQPPRRWHSVYDYGGSLPRLRRALEQFEVSEVDLVAVLGDVTEHGDRASLDVAVAELLRLSPAPVMIVPGNHDRHAGGRDLEQAVGRAAGRVSVATWTPVELGGISILGVALGRGEGGRGYLAGPPAAAPSTAAAVVLLSHFPVFDLRQELDARGLRYSGNLRDRGRLASFLDALDRPVIALGGHLHVRRSIASGGVLQLLTGALIEPPYEFAMVDVALDAGLEVRYRAVPEAVQPEGISLPVLSPARSHWSFQDGRWRRLRWDQPSASTSGPERSRSDS